MRLSVRSLLCLLSFSFSTVSFENANKGMIKWKKMETKEQVIAELNKYIHPGDELYRNYKFLEQEQHEFIQLKEDSVILFHSPYVPVHRFAMVSRKWMFTFHYKDSKLDHYDVEEGLLGP